MFMSATNSQVTQDRPNVWYTVIQFDNKIVTLDLFLSKGDRDHDISLKTHLEGQIDFYRHHEYHSSAFVDFEAYVVTDNFTTYTLVKFRNDTAYVTGRPKSYLYVQLRGYVYNADALIDEYTHQSMIIP